jgi:hypothetical protein
MVNQSGGGGRSTSQAQAKQNPSKHGQAPTLVLNQKEKEKERVGESRDVSHRTVALGGVWLRSRLRYDAPC